MKLTGVNSLAKEDKEKFDSWTKEQIYEAYLSEYEARRFLEQSNKRLERKLAKIRFYLKQLEM